jgi:hypothetical protein
MENKSSIGHFLITAQIKCKKLRIREKKFQYFSKGDHQNINEKKTHF